MEVWSVYLIQCGDGTLYCGISTDVARRFEEHTAGTGAKYTRGRGPLVLVFQEEAGNLSAALKRERQIKKLARSDKISLIENGRQNADQG